MKNIIDVLYEISTASVNIAEKISKHALIASNEIAKGSLSITGGLLHSLSWVFFFVEEWQEGLVAARDNVDQSKDVVNDVISNSIEKVQQAFKSSQESLELAKNYSIDFIYDNRMISSIIGSVNHDEFGLSDIQMSFRSNGKDISADDVIEQFKSSDCKELILLIPGLFCDETLWEDKYEKQKDGSEIFFPGLSPILLSKKLFPVYIRFNHGKHISLNGKLLLNLVDSLFEKYDGEMKIISYSQGSLLLRSLLYYAKTENKPWYKKVSTTLLISSPDGGSYLEKVGFWLGFLMESTPILVINLIGLIGNLRSDGIKDLSHGVIRDEDWKYSAQIRRYTNEKYFGELDDIDAYQIYSVFSEKNDSFSELLGDGIIEKPSLEFLRDRVFRKKANPETRTIEVRLKNHFSIMTSEELFDFVKKIY